MGAKGIKRAERRKRSWGAHSINWNRCTDPSYYCELAHEMHHRKYVVQETLQQHNQVVGLLCELLSCFSAWTSNNTKHDVAEMLKGAHWRDDGGLSFIGVEQQAHQMRITSMDIYDYTDYQAGDEGEPPGPEDVVYIVGLPEYTDARLEPHNITLRDLTASLASVELSDRRQAARAA